MGPVGQKRLPRFRRSVLACHASRLAIVRRTTIQDGPVKKVYACMLHLVKTTLPIAADPQKTISPYKKYENVIEII